jgi:hypothetical protein
MRRIFSRCQQRLLKLGRTSQLHSPNATIESIWLDHCQQCRRRPTARPHMLGFETSSTIATYWQSPGNAIDAGRRAMGQVCALRPAALEARFQLPASSRQRVVPRPNFGREVPAPIAKQPPGDPLRSYDRSEPHVLRVAGSEAQPGNHPWGAHRSLGFWAETETASTFAVWLRHWRYCVSLRAMPFETATLRAPHHPRTADAATVSATWH